MVNVQRIKVPIEVCKLLIACSPGVLVEWQDLHPSSLLRTTSRILPVRYRVTEGRLTVVGLLDGGIGVYLPSPDLARLKRENHMMMCQSFGLSG